VVRLIAYKMLMPALEQSSSSVAVSIKLLAFNASAVSVRKNAMKFDSCTASGRSSINANQVAMSGHSRDGHFRVGRCGSLIIGCWLAQLPYAAEYGASKVQN
jgi:hypothetical protein